MNKFATFKELLAAENLATPAGPFLVNLALAALLALLLGAVYARFGRSLSNRRDFASNFPLIAVTTALVIGIVKSSLALSLGMVGALSIVRFRAAIKEPEELSHLFLSLAIGVGMGADQRLLTLLAFAFILPLVVLMGIFRSRPAAGPFVLVVTAAGDARPLLAGLEPLLSTHARAARFRRYEERDGLGECAYEFAPRDAASLATLRDAIRGLAPGAKVAILDGAAGL